MNTTSFLRHVPAGTEVDFKTGFQSARVPLVAMADEDGYDSDANAEICV